MVGRAWGEEGEILVHWGGGGLLFEQSGHRHCGISGLWRGEGWGWGDGRGGESASAKESGTVETGIPCGGGGGVGGIDAWAIE